MLPTLEARARWLVLAALVLGVSGTGCASCGQTGIGAISGPINDPSNRTLRREILSYGIDQFCAELLKHDAPLKMAEDQPVIGRFYPSSCQARTLPDGNLFVSMAGSGYAWTNVTKKLAFDMNASIEYDQDFLMDGSTMYAYFRTKQVQQSNFRTRVIESSMASMANQVTQLGDNFGRQLLAGKLAEGFTVIRDKDGNADFGLGIIELGKRPVHPFDVHGSSRITYENTRTEVHQNERDFVGPIVVDGDGKAIYVTAMLDGLPMADLLLMRKDAAEASLGYFTGYPQAGPLAGAPMFGDVMRAGMQYARTLPVPKGTYYLIFDNTPSAGQVAPPVNLLDDRAITIDYVVQIGDAP